MWSKKRKNRKWYRKNKKLIGWVHEVQHTGRIAPDSRKQKRENHQSTNSTEFPPTKDRGFLIKQ